MNLAEAIRELDKARTTLFSVESHQHQPIKGTLFRLRREIGSIIQTLKDKEKQPNTTVTTAKAPNTQKCV